VDGAYERVQENICDMRKGIKTRRNHFISTEAIIQVTSSYRRITLEEAKLRHDNKSEAERSKTKSAIYEDGDLWNEARQFDQTDHGGQRFVKVNQMESGIVFSFSDGRYVTIDLAELLASQGFHKLFAELVAECREHLIKKTEDENITEMARYEVEMTRVVSDLISKTTLWENRLVSQAVEQLSSSEKTLLNTRLPLLLKVLPKATRIINKAHNKVSVQDVSRAIQNVIEDLDEQ
jgi:hypothetical protein